MQQIIRYALFTIIVIEISVNSFISFKTTEYTDRDDYLSRHTQIQELLDKGGPGSHVNFYRADMSIKFTKNDPYFFRYNGITYYSSMIKNDIIKFTTGLGLNANEVSIVYLETSPLTSTFLNLRYMMIPKDHQNFDTQWVIAGQSADLLLLENKYYLPLGFMVNEDMASYMNNESNLFMSQNNLFHQATGLQATGFDGNLFTIKNITNDALVQKDNVQKRSLWNYEVQSEKMLYIYLEIGTDNLKEALVFVNDEPLFLLEINIRGGLPIRDLKQGDIISVAAGSDVSIYIVYLDEELLEQGYKQLASQPLILTEFTNTKVKGHVNVLEDGLLYTSIPGKNWNVYVNGEKNEMVLIDNAMAAVRLSKGYHEVEFRYFNPSFAVGIAISLVSLAVFVFLVVLEKVHTKTQRHKGAKKNEE